MSKLLALIVGLTCAAAVLAADDRPARKVWTAQDVIAASGGTLPAAQPAQAVAEPEPPLAATKPMAKPATSKPSARNKTAAKATKKAVTAKKQKHRAKRAHKPTRR